jgi:hypothetical protein
MLATLRGALALGGALGFALSSIAGSATAGKLRDAGRETRTPSSRSTSNDSSNSSSNESRSSGCCHNDDGGALVLYVLVAPWVGPHVALEPNDRGTAVFESFPYAHGSRGLLRYREPTPTEGLDGEPENEASVQPPPPPGKSVAGQVRAEGGYVLGGVYRGALGGRLMLPGRLELDANVNGLMDPVENGGVDRATFGNAHVAVRFAQSEQVQFRTGLGYQQFADQYGVEPGIDFLYGFEAQLGAHLILSVSGNLGSAGHALVGQIRGSLGVMLDRFEIYAGYDHISIGDVPLGGPAAGIRAWF